MNASEIGISFSFYKEKNLGVTISLSLDKAIVSTKDPSCFVILGSMLGWLIEGLNSYN